MLCALTVRTLEPGTFDQFREAFLRYVDPEHPGAGWVRFDMIRNTSDPEEVITFGLFDGTVDELRATAAGGQRDEQRAAIAPFVRATGADGIYEVVTEYRLEPAGA